MFVFLARLVNFSLVLYITVGNYCKLFIKEQYLENENVMLKDLFVPMNQYTLSITKTRK